MPRLYFSGLVRRWKVAQKWTAAPVHPLLFCTAAPALGYGMLLACDVP